MASIRSTTHLCDLECCSFFLSSLSLSLLLLPPFGVSLSLCQCVPLFLWCVVLTVVRTNTKQSYAVAERKVSRRVVTVVTTVRVDSGRVTSGTQDPMSLGHEWYHLAHTQTCNTHTHKQFALQRALFEYSVRVSWRVCRFASLPHCALSCRWLEMARTTRQHRKKHRRKGRQRKRKQEGERREEGENGSRDQSRTMSHWSLAGA